MTQRLLKKLGEGKVVEYWQRHGMYKASELLSIEMQEYVSPYVLRYMSNKFSWKRECSPRSAIYAGVKRGTISAKNFPHLIFPIEMRNEKYN